MRLSRSLFVLLFALLASAPALAQQPASPYSVTVPVVDTSAAQRDQAFAIALGQVMTRVAGGQDLRGKAGYNDALKSASSQVQQYQYQQAATGLVLNVEFAPDSVRRTVAQLGVTSAGIKPPLLLLVQGSDGSLLGPDALASLAEAAAAGGTRITYPDAGDDIDLAKVAAVDPAALAGINERYQTGLVLLGRLAGGQADWTLVSGGAAQHWTSQGLSQDALLAEAGDAVADRLGSQLNVIGAGSSEGTLWVSGLASANDYADMLATLAADPAVQSVTTLEANGDGVLLALKARLPMSGLAVNLAAGGRLLRQNPPHDGADATLRWLH